MKMTTDLRSSIWCKFLLFCIGLFVAGALFAEGEDDERGLGGTGLRTAAIIDMFFADERGMGGTGIVGTITAFGSIWVNGIEIEYTPSTELTVDGEQAGDEQLRLGQQVEVSVRRREGMVYADAIAIGHELIGPVESIDSENRTLRVLGQRVVFETAAPGRWPSPLQAGDVVKVSGYRGEDDTILATDVAVDSNAAYWLLRGYAHQREGLFYLADYPLPDSMEGTSEGDRVLLWGDFFEGQPSNTQGKIVSHLPFNGAMETLLIEGVRKRDGSIRYAGGRIRSSEILYESDSELMQREYLLIHQKGDQDRPGTTERSGMRGADPHTRVRGEMQRTMKRSDTPDPRPPTRDGRPDIYRPQIEEFNKRH
jgi:hypothetical protein